MNCFILLAVYQHCYHAIIDWWQEFHFSVVSNVICKLYYWAFLYIWHTLDFDCLAVQPLFGDLDCQKCNREQEWLSANQIIEHWKGQSHTVYYSLLEIVLGIKILWCLISQTKIVMRTGNSTGWIKIRDHNFYGDGKLKKKPNQKHRNSNLLSLYLVF